MYEFLVTAPRGLEYPLRKELEALNLQEVREGGSGAYFKGEITDAYRVCLWSRIAARVLLPLGEFEFRDEKEYYKELRKFPWDKQMSPNATLAVDFGNQGGAIGNTLYGAQLSKDALVDYFRDEFGSRPSVDKERPDFRLHVRVRGKTAKLFADISGEGLHRRGYRTQGGEAPLKENLACALLFRAGWGEIINQETDFAPVLYDPLCGAGSLLVEGALMAADVAPGIFRKYYGFFRRADFNADAWEQMKAEAEERRENGLKRLKERGFVFRGNDRSAKAVKIARENARRAGLEDIVIFEKRRLTEPGNPFPERRVGKKAKEQDSSDVLIVTNPPYGERLGDETELIYLHATLGAKLKKYFPGARLTLIDGAPEYLPQLRMRSESSYKVNNGALPCVIQSYKLEGHKPTGEHKPIDPKNILEFEEEDKLSVVLNHSAAEFMNRLKKNRKRLRKWVASEGLESFRIYDADIPAYNSAIDVYKSHLVVSEYAPPADLDQEKSDRRFQDLLLVTKTLTGVDPRDIAVKQRRRQKGDEQYGKNPGDKKSTLHKTFRIQEYGCRFEVNLYDYLDTGLFLDHRLTRRMVGEMAKGKSFLNLFAYTGTATVYAALGGATRTVTVDSSRNYLEWAARNLELNKIDGVSLLPVARERGEYSDNRGPGRGRQTDRHLQAPATLHRLIRADCLKWVRTHNEKYDLIFLDPPTFSNSKDRQESFDVQRDHLELIRDVKGLLAPGGVLVFSNNRRKFKLDQKGIERMGLVAQDLTENTIPEDFKRRPGIHHCFTITFAGRKSGG